ncbi:unnamed protein product [Timema podura]|uniref:Uncharacterized protein n=1 Tax=Timema podura TaxID=61482 RepID=A0ABN7NF96_TIMPD|nr:unnamed protein product [Timema podura]
MEEDMSLRLFVFTRNNEFFSLVLCDAFKLFANFVAVYIFKFLFCIHIPEDDEGPYLPTTQNSYLAVTKKRSKNIQDKEYVLGKKM